MRKCKIEDCSKSVVGHDLCGMHLKRLKEKGRLERYNQYNKGKVCAECSLPAKAKGLCNIHYQRAYYKPHPRKEKPPQYCHCGGKIHARSLCRNHYQQWWKQNRKSEVTVFAVNLTRLR